MLNFFTTSNGFRSTLPVVSNLTAMNVWDGVCMCFIYASLLEFVCVNYVGRKRPLHNVVYRPGENPVTQVNSITMQAKSTENAKTNKNQGPLSRGRALCRVPQICYASQAIKYEFYISVQPKKNNYNHNNNSNSHTETTTISEQHLMPLFFIPSHLPTQQNETISKHPSKSHLEIIKTTTTTPVIVLRLCVSLSLYISISLSLYLSLSFCISLSNNHIFICLLLSFRSLSVLTT